MIRFSNLNQCVAGCNNMPTKYFLIGDYHNGFVVACCNEHVNIAGLCGWHAEVIELSRKEMEVLQVLND